MRRAGGYALAVGPGGDKPIECDTFTCAHCNCVVMVTPGQAASDLGGFCRCCMSHICGPCADQGTCTPFMKKVEESEEKCARRRQNEKALGLDGV